MQGKNQAQGRAASRLVNAREAAERLGLSVWTVYHWAISRRISSVKLGRRRLFQASDLEEFVERRREPELGSRIPLAEIEAEGEKDQSPEPLDEGPLPETPAEGADG